MLSRTSENFARGSFFLGVTAVTSIILISMLDLISRTAGRPISWAPEVSSYLFCFAICASMCHVTRQGAQIAVTLLQEMLPTRARRRLVMFTESLSFAVCLAIAVLCLQIAWQQYELGTTTVADIAIRKWILSAMLAYGFLSSGLMHLLNALSARNQTGFSQEGGI